MQAQESAEAQTRLLAALNRLTQATSAVQDLQTSLQTIARELVELFDIPSSGIALFNVEQAAIRVVAYHSSKEEESSEDSFLNLSDIS